MKARSFLWKLCVQTTLEAEEAVTEVLQELLHLPVSSYVNAETKRVAVTSYLKTVPGPWAVLRSTLAGGLERIRRAGLDPGPGEISLRQIRREDWANSWKRHFRPLEISRALLVKPGWSKRRAKPGQAVVVLDPGLSFGTGQHPTTAFCLQQIARFTSPYGSAAVRSRKRLETPAVQRARRNAKPAFLDIGTGSGILAIASAKLGCSPVHAFDFDPEAVRVARNNARRNRVLPRVQIRRADLARLPRRAVRRYDLVCANLISNLLIAERAKIVDLVKPGGRLVVAGVLHREFAEVQAAFEAAGLKLVRSRVEKEWQSGAFAVPMRG